MLLRPPQSPQGAMKIIAPVLLAAVYLGAARLGLLLATVHGSVSPVWPATGVAIGALLVGGCGLWPGVLLGAFLANVLTPVPLGVVMAIAVGNTAEAIAGAWVARQSAIFLRRLELETLADAAAIVVASVVAPLVSATCGVLALRASDPNAAATAATLWRTWWVGDAVGALLIAPLLIAIAEASPRWRGWTFAAVLKSITVYGASAGVCWAVFFKPASVGLLFGVFPVMLLAAVWLGSSGVKITAVLVSAVGLSAAYFGFGPFASGSLNEDLLHLQLFLTSVALAALVLPAFRAAGSLSIAGGVLLIMWLVSGWLFAALHRDRLRADNARLDVLITEAGNSIRQRLTTYEDALRGGAGLLAVANQVSRAEWRSYARSVNLPDRYPGVRGIGVIFPVPSSEEAAFVATERAAGAPDFSIHEVPPAEGGEPRAPQADRFVITYIEPVAGNREAIGLDVASEPNRRRAAEISRDTGEPRITGRITLVQDDQQRPGFLLLLPIYRSEATTDTVAQRRTALVAWIYSPFVTQAFLQGVLEPRMKEIEVRVFWGETTAPSKLVYASGSGVAPPFRFERVTQLMLGGQSFTFGWNRTARFVPAGQSTAVWAATSMALISLLLAGLVMSLHAVGRRAREIAAGRTAELAASADRLLKLNAQLEEKNTEFRNFAHTASHDLREPLRAIQGFSAILAEDFKDALPAPGHGIVQRIRSAAGRMSALIENLLAYAELGSSVGRREKVDLNEVLQEVEHDLQPRIASVSARIQRQAPLPAVLGDRTQLRQLFQNLLGNALKFRRSGVAPIVTIKAETIPAAGQEHAPVRITVADNGIGFAPAQAERIFRPFDRLHGRAEFEGSGLGLAICKRVVERHGGEIHATGAPGVGANFVFTLPGANGLDDGEV